MLGRDAALERRNERIHLVVDPMTEVHEIVVAVSIPEVDDVLRPTPSRYAHMAIVDTIATGVATRLGSRGRDALRRVRYAITRIGVAIPTPSMDPTPLMNRSENGD